jgi:hypothetical protein
MTYRLGEFTDFFTAKRSEKSDERVVHDYTFKSIRPKLRQGPYVIDVFVTDIAYTTTRSFDVSLLNSYHSAAANIPIS